MCGATAHVSFGPEADMCSARLVPAKAKAGSHFKVGWAGKLVIGDHVTATAARSVADLSPPKRGMCRRPAIRSAVNHLRAYVFANASEVIVGCCLGNVAMGSA